LILGAIGRNFGAGMTGGVAYVYDPPGVAPRHVAETSPSIVRPKDADLDVIGRLVAAHYAATGSRRAAELLADWDEARKSFWVVRPESRVASRESTVEREGAGA
jgi:glutamate synthase (NADPH/NADH) large chain